MKRRLSGLFVLIILAQTLGTRGFPDSLNIGLAEPITNLQSWVRKNRKGHSKAPRRVQAVRGGVLVAWARNLSSRGVGEIGQVH